jgi:hypothetical protein
MNFTRMQEHLRLELVRRIQRGTLSVSLLSRQTGYAPAHLSNFIHGRRQLSLEAMDQILAVQHLTALDLAPSDSRSTTVAMESEHNAVPVVSHPVALFEPLIRSSAVLSLLHLPPGALESIHARSAPSRHAWQRFVAVRIPSADALAMDPLVLPEAMVLLDRHFTSLAAYRPGRPNVYAVRHGAHLRLRYVDFLHNRLVLRPYNLAFPVDLVEIAPGEAPNDLIAGRAALILNEL